MEDVQKNILNKLKNYIDELLQRLDRLEEENRQLIVEKKQLFEKLKQKDEIIDNLKHEIEILNLGNAFIANAKGENLSEKRHEAKNKLRHLIKNIDATLKIISEL